MGELLKTAQSKRTSPEAQQQIVALVGSWAADAEFKRNPLLAAQFGASHEQLTAQAAGRPQMAIFSPLVAEHGDQSAAPQHALAPTSSTRGPVEQVAAAVGQMRMLVAPPAVPSGPPSASHGQGGADAPLPVVEDDALPGVAAAAATPGSVRAPDALSAGDLTDDEIAEIEIAADEEEQALQVRRGESGARAARGMGGGGWGREGACARAPAVGRGGRLPVGEGSRREERRGRARGSQERG